jgi:DNA-binding NtrC family response regulator
VKKGTATLLARFRKRRAAPARPSVPWPVQPQVPVLLASARDSDRLAIEGVLAATRYMLVPTASLNQASNLLSHVVFPIILYDCGFQGGDWQPALGRLIGAWRSPSIVLLSETYSHDFWEESVCRGAFDVLVRPFQTDDVLAVLDFAYTNWKLGFTRRTSSPETPAALAARGAATA